MKRLPPKNEHLSEGTSKVAIRDEFQNVPVVWLYCQVTQDEGYRMRVFSKKLCHSRLFSGLHVGKLQPV